MSESRPPTDEDEERDRRNANIVLLVFGAIVVFVAEHFVRPVLIGNSTRLPFLLVLFGILGGAETFGLLGIFIGPALMTVLMVLWTDLAA